MQLKKIIIPNSKPLKILRFVSHELLEIGTAYNNITVFNHDDSDGKLGAHLIYETFGLKDTKHFMCCNYSAKIPKVSFVKKDDLVCIVDYCIPLDQLKPIVENAKLVLFMDHHKTSIDIINDNFEYFEKQVKAGKMVIDVDVTRCGARIVNDWFYRFNTDWNDWNTKVVDLIDNYDRWTGKDIRGDYLNQFVYNSAMSYVGSEVWCRLLHDEDYLQRAISIGKKFYDLNLLKNDIIYTSFSKEIEFHNLKISAIEGFGNSYLFGKHTSEYDACCVYHKTSNDKWQYSLYSENKSLDLTKIAESYGGGGHPQACGWTIDEKLF